MVWQDFFKLVVHLEKNDGTFFSAILPTPKEFSFEDLLVKNFDHLKLTSSDKRKLSLNLRKILICHELFETKEFKKICEQFAKKISKMPQQKLSFSTQGGGIYLFLSIANHPLLKGKEILVFTSELPVRSETKHYSSPIEFIYRPHARSYLSDFSFFELKDKKASA